MLGDITLLQIPLHILPFIVKKRKGKEKKNASLNWGIF
jgi:hypothetical protein